MPSREELKMLQALPLDVKIRKTQKRIHEWVDEYGEDGVYVSFSGGKDSTVLLHIIRQMYPDIQAVFSDTGLEYPAIRRFVGINKKVTWLKPKMNFKDVIINYGYPVVGKEVAEYVWAVRHSGEGSYKEGRKQRLMGIYKRRDGKLSQYNRPKWGFLLEAPFEISPMCCMKMKKEPMNQYAKANGKYPIMATMTQESKLRETKWLKNGCNAFVSKRPDSTPMAFWIEQDVLKYLYVYHDDIVRTLIDVTALKNKEAINPWAECYGQINMHITEDEIKGQISIQEVLQDYRECKFCTTGCKRTGCIFCLFGITQDPERIRRVQEQEPAIADFVLRGGEFNKKGMWQPSKEGMGFWFVIRWLVIHGNLYIPFLNGKEYENKYGNELTQELLTIQN